MAASTSRIVVDAGGRTFHTTRDTLLMSGAGYFTALFGPTGAALGTLENNDGGVADEAESSETSGPSAKRSRTDPTEIFVDRNPGLFSVVLDFMRSGKLPAKVRQDVNLLEDLTTEAEFFIYDALKTACEDAKNELKEALSEILGSEPKAEYNSVILYAQDDDRSTRPRITVPRGKVLYLVSAVLAGRLGVMRYCKEDEKKKAIRRCYIECDNKDSGDFKLHAKVDGKSVCIAHCGMNHIHDQGKSSLDVDFRQPLSLCLSGGENDTVSLYANGHADWHIVYWVGDVEAIPGLKAPDAADTRGLKITKHLATNGDGGDNDTLITLLAMQQQLMMSRSRSR